MSDKSLRKYVTESTLLLEYNRDKTIERHGQGALDRAVSVVDSDDANRRTPHAVETVAHHFHSNGDHDRAKSELMNHFEKGDPTPNHKYVPHIAHMYAKGGVHMEDIHSRMKPALEQFHELSKRNKIPSEHRDLGRYKNLSQLEDIVDAHKEVESKNEVKDSYHEKMKSPEHSTIEDHPTFTHIVPHTEEAAKHFGKGTRWCTSADENNYFQHYSQEGPLRIYTPKKPSYPGEKYQAHYGSGSLMDEKDLETRHEDISRSGHHEMVNHMKMYDQHVEAGITNPTKDHNEPIVRANHAMTHATTEELEDHLKDPSPTVRQMAMENENLSDHHGPRIKELSKTDRDAAGAYYKRFASSDEIHDLIKGEGHSNDMDMYNHPSAFHGSLYSKNFNSDHVHQALREHPVNLNEEDIQTMMTKHGKPEHYDQYMNSAHFDTKGINELGSGFASGLINHINSSDEARNNAKNSKNLEVRTMFNSRVANSEELHHAIKNWKPGYDGGNFNPGTAENFGEEHVQPWIDKMKEHGRLESRTGRSLIKLRGSMINNDHMDQLIDHHKSLAGHDIDKVSFGKTLVDHVVDNLGRTSSTGARATDPPKTEHISYAIDQAEHPQLNHLGNQIWQDSFNADHVNRIFKRAERSGNTHVMHRMIERIAGKDGDPKVEALKENCKKYNKFQGDNNLVKRYNSWANLRTGGKAAHLEESIEEMLKKYKPSNAIDISGSELINETGLGIQHTSSDTFKIAVRNRLTKSKATVTKHTQKEKSMFHTNRTNDALSYGFRRKNRGIGAHLTNKDGDQLTDRTTQERNRRVRDLRAKNIGESVEYLKNTQFIHQTHSETAKKLAGRERDPELKRMDLHRSKKHAHASAIIDKLIERHKGKKK